MTALGKTLLALGAALVLVFGALVALPVVFEDRIAERVQAEIDEAVDARVAWSGVGLSLLRSFPNLSFRLEGLTVDGVDQFEGHRLASMREFRLVLDLGSVVRALRRGEQIVVRSIELDEPVLHLKVLEDGTANWDIVRAAADERAREPRAAPAFDLRRFEIRNATIVLDHEPAALFASLDGFHHSLQGDFSRDLFDLRTRTRSEEVTLHFAGVPYLNRVELDARADLQADLANGRYSFKDNEVRLNDLRLALAGSAARVGDQVELDVTFAAPRTDFKSILSLVPAIYTRDFAAVQTAGAMRVDGRVSGAYGEDALPAFAVRAVVDGAMFRYPDLPLAARDIFVDLAVENSGGDADDTVVTVDRFHMKLGDEAIDAALVMRTPVSDPDIDFRLAGRIDLADVSRTLRLEDFEELRGVVAADVAVRTRLSYMEEEQYERVAASGDVAIRNLAVRNAQLPHTVVIEEALLRLSPQHAELTSFRGAIGSSDVSLSGRLDNLIGFALRDQDLRGSASFSSGHFDLDEWRSDDEGLDVIPVPARLDFVLDAEIARLTLDNLEMTDTRGRLRVEDRRLTLEDFRLNTLGGEVGLSGYYETTDVAKPTFDVALAIRDLDVPGAFGAFVTVRTLAPIARYARGSFSADLTLNGGLGTDMVPLFELLNGRGSLATSTLALQGFPPLDRLADRLQLERLHDPVMDGIRSSIEIRDGRLYSGPFDVRIGDSSVRVAGWNGLDESLEYALALRVPRTALGSGADRVIGQLIAQAGRAGLTLEAADVIELAVQLTGTVTNPSISTRFGAVIGSTREEVDRILRDAERRGAQVREAGRRAAEAVRSEGYQRADELLERATEPVARAAARPAADRLRAEADENADRMIREADQRADNIVAEARWRAGAPPKVDTPPSES